MAEITRRRTGELLRKLFNILMAAPDGCAGQCGFASSGQSRHVDTL